MLINSVIDNENNRWKRNTKNKNKKQIKTKTKKNKWDGSNSETDLNNFVVRKDFFQLICKASLIFKSNLGLPLSIILKEKNYTSKACCGGVQMF